LGGLALFARARLSEAQAARDAAQRERAALMATVETAPIGGFLWRGDNERSLGALPGRGAVATFSDVLPMLDAETATRLSASVAALRSAGTAFVDTALLADGTAYAVTGRPTDGGDAVVWLGDISRTRA